MIVSASFRTDIPAFYGEWFTRRFEAGSCMVANPYGGPPYRVALREGVDGYVFWTRHAAPFLPALAMVRDAGFPFIVQYTLTGYPRQIERATPPAATSVSLMRRLAARFGPRTVVWRYDPIVTTTRTPPDWHPRNFARIAAGLEGVVDEVVTSFAEPYVKTRRNMAQAAVAGGFSWRTPDLEEKRALLARLEEIAAAHGMRLSLCTQPELAGKGGAKAAACIDAARLSDVAGRPVIAKLKGNRPGCLCAQSRDIGDYDGCPMGCAYCYAVSSRGAARARRRAHDPGGDFLFERDSPRNG